MNRNLVLLQNNEVQVPSATNSPSQEKNRNSRLATVLSNMAYYGYTVNADVFLKLQSLNGQALEQFWSELEVSLKEMTGANRRMDNFVVYKNFPKEVLNKNETEYWLSQILMYIGLPNEYFTEEVKDRPKMTELTKLKVLSAASSDAFQNVYAALQKLPVRWNDTQTSVMRFLLRELNVTTIDITSFGFKENGIVLLSRAINDNVEKLSYSIPDATDVLRLAAALSNGDVSLRERVKFNKFSRPERKLLLGQLELSKNLESDVAMRPEEWKRFLSTLHPGDYKFSRVQSVYDKLYNRQLDTFNSKVESGIRTASKNVLGLLASRPGEFARRLHKLYATFGADALAAFKKVVPELETIQLLKLSGYVSTINTRKELMYAPKGNWSKVQVAENKKVPFDDAARNELMNLLNSELKARMELKFPSGVAVDAKVAEVKIQTNDQKLAAYGRGTSFDIPEEIKFVRTASYWKSGNTAGRNIWYDNGWNFFDSSWQPVATVCWNGVKFKDAAVFSGDPTNSKDMQGRACQMIDLYLDKLKNEGVKYAVWNILGYSGVDFDSAEEVLATLQWGEKPEKGNLYEPSRAQMVFPLKGKNLTKYVAYIDVESRKLVYMDANLPGNVSSARANQKALQDRMPAFVEYLQTLPSVADLFVEVKSGDTKILYSDSDVQLDKGEKAFVFKKENEANNFENMAITDLLV